MEDKEDVHICGICQVLVAVIFHFACNAASMEIRVLSKQLTARWVCTSLPYREQAGVEHLADIKR